MHAVQRRLRDIEVPFLNQLRHMPEEERQQKGSYVRAVDVRIGHDDDTVVSKLGEVQPVGAGPQGCGEVPDFLVCQDLVLRGLLYVENLAPERQDSLKAAVPSLFGRTAGGVSLNQVEFAELGVLL